MSHTQTRKLFQKFILDECTPQETKQVIQYFREQNLTEGFPTVEEVKQLLGKDLSYNQDSANDIFTNIMKKVNEKEKETKIKALWYRYTAVAATLLVLLGTGWFFLVRNDQDAAPYIDPNQITLQLEDGRVQVIDENGKITIKDALNHVVATQEEGSMVYDAADTEELIYNTLRIPYGKRFRIRLSDGTMVHLNAGTTLKFPVKFLPGQKRRVYLDGEAYFDVTKDKLHPFIVNADNLNIRVLGTRFNISDYPEDDATDVVLVEGSVGLHTGSQDFDPKNDVILSPGYKASLNKTAGNITTKKVSTGMYTAWIYGELVFRNMTFKNIAKKLERHYNVTIRNNDKALEKARFNASFRNEPVENVLSYFKELDINYTVKKDTITIKP